MELNKDNLEKALSGEKIENKPQESQMSPEMEIGFHQGALNTLSGERQGLYQMIQQVEQRIHAHVERMKQLGVKFEEKKE